MRAYAIAACCFLCAIPVTAGEKTSHSGALPAGAEAYWNQFRGARTDGTAAATGLPVTWSESQNVRWKTAIHGKGWSSPVVWGKQIWMTTATENGKELFAICVDLDSGKIVHDVKVFQIDDPMYCHPMNSYATPTPVVEEGRVYVHFGSAGTACLDTKTARVLWTRQDLPCNHFRGPGSSPIVYRNLLIINFDGFDFQYVAALDKQTGKTVWKQDRDIDYGTDNGDAKKAYCTPTVIEVDGRMQLVSPASSATIAYDPETGKELWKVKTGGFNNAARPLFGHGMVILNMEGGVRLCAVKPNGTGDVTKTHMVWTCSKSTPTRPSQLLIGERIFMVSDNGVVSCLDVKTGEPVWTERLEGRHSASPVFADGRIYFFGEDGEMRVIAPADEFKLLADNKLSSGCMASPAIAGKSLIVRTKRDLYRIEQMK